MNTIAQQLKIISDIDFYLRNNLQLSKKKLWENTYIRHQIYRREKGHSFSIIDHIRGMIYSMLSSSIAWERIESKIDKTTGHITPVDEIFKQYSPDYILTCEPEGLRDQLKKIHCAGVSTKKQMTALIQVNIPKLQKIIQEFHSIDTCFERIINLDNTKKELIKKLSSSSSELKLAQLGEALTAEYLRNVGYDLPKPDRHIRRILGKDILGFSEHTFVPVYDVLDIIERIATYSKKHVAEIDYILWSYCAKGFGEICTKKNPKCTQCIIHNYCNKAQGRTVDKI